MKRIDEGTPLGQSELVERTGQEEGTQKGFLFSRWHHRLLLRDVSELARPREEAGESEERHFRYMEGPTQRPEGRLNQHCPVWLGMATYFSVASQNILICVTFFDDILEIYVKLIQKEKTNGAQSTGSG